jgi:hypothetical protein
VRVGGGAGVVLSGQEQVNDDAPALPAHLRRLGVAQQVLRHDEAARGDVDFHSFGARRERSSQDANRRDLRFWVFHFVREVYTNGFGNFSQSTLDGIVGAFVAVLDSALKTYPNIVINILI